MNESKVWFITGASSGFGRALAEHARTRGERVVAPTRDTLDVTNAEQIRAAVASAIATYGRIDVLVNNAGYGVVGAVEETSDGELRAALEAMFFGAVALTREVLPHMRARRSGTIVQVTSMGGVTTAPGFGAYCAAKHALEGLSECLAAEVAPLGIRVLIVEPGAFRTRLFGAGFRAMPALAIADAVDAGVPLRLPLGADAVNGIRAKLAAVAADVDRAAAVATAF